MAIYRFLDFLLSFSLGRCGAEGEGAGGFWRASAGVISRATLMTRDLNSADSIRLHDPWTEGSQESFETCHRFNGRFGSCGSMCREHAKTVKVRPRYRQE